MILCPRDMLRAVDEEEPLLCITDAKDEIVPLTLLKGAEVVVLAVTSNVDVEIVEAFSDGADWVETSPLDFDRPHGLGTFARVDG